MPVHSDGTRESGNGTRGTAGSVLRFLESVPGERKGTSRNLCFICNENCPNTGLLPHILGVEECTMSEKPTKLSNAEVKAALDGLAGWSLEKGKLHREYKFANFVEAFGFMASAALVAESMNHHPEWSNVYRAVKIDLTTHDLGGVSARDLEMAKRFETLARSRAGG